jgi:transposase-like protein
MGKRRREVWAKWRRVLAEQQLSGQSVAAFCRERGVCAPQFYVWKKRLAEEVSAEFVAVQVVSGGEPLRSRALEIRLPGSRSVMVEPGFDADHLHAVLAALEARA